MDDQTNLPANHRSSSLPSSGERADHREWIGGRAATLLMHYWREDDPAELNSAMGADWADVLEGIPREYIQKACVRYQRDEPRKKPTPGAIYQLARSLMPTPRVAYSAPPPPEDPERVPCSAEKAAEIMAAAGFKPKRFGGDNG